MPLHPSTRVITLPTQTTMHYSREIPRNTFPFFEPLIPQINGLPLTLAFWKKKSRNKFPAATPGPQDQLPPAKHLSNAARFATRPAGPVIDLDRPGTQERNKRGPLKCHGFWGLDVG